MYKNLKHDKLPLWTTAVAIFREAEAVRTLLRRSPLRFTMEISGSGTVESDYGDASSHEEVAQHIAGPRESDAMDDMQQRAEAAQNDTTQSTPPPPVSSQLARGAWGLPQTTRRTFSSYNRDRKAKKPSAPPLDPDTNSGPREYQIQVNLSRMNHTDNINANHYSGNFAINTKSAAQEDLAKRVPMIGLSDVNLRPVDKPWRVVLWQRRNQKNEMVPLSAMLQQGALEMQEKRARKENKNRDAANGEEGEMQRGDGEKDGIFRPLSSMKKIKF